MESFLDLIRSYEMFHRLDRVISLSAVIPLICFLPHLLCTLSFICMSDTIHMLEEDANVRITGEITAASPPPRPIAGMDSSVGASTISDEVVDFFREFDKRTSNPHPEWHFWKFNGPLVSFGDF